MFARESATVTVDGSLQYKAAAAKWGRVFSCSLERVAARSIAASRHRKPSLSSVILDASISIVDERSLARWQQRGKKTSFSFENVADADSSRHFLLMGRLHARILLSCMREGKIKSHLAFRRKCCKVALTCAHTWSSPLKWWKLGQLKGNWIDPKLGNYTVATEALCKLFTLFLVCRYQKSIILSLDCSVGY